MAKRIVEEDRGRVRFQFDQDELAILRDHDEKYNDSFETIYVQLAGVQYFDQLLAHLQIQIINQS